MLRHTPDPYHLSTDHPHLQPLIITPSNTTLSLTLIVRSTVHYPEQLPDSLMLLTCMYLPFDLQTYLQCYSSESSTLIPLVPGPLSTSKPARIQTVNIQLSSQELVTVFILTCHYSPRSPIPCHSIKLPTVYLPVVS